MGKPYASELQKLEATFQWATTVDITAMRNAVVESAGLPLIAVGSGGSLTAAHLLVSAHRRYTGQVAAVSTPLDAAVMRLNPRRSIWLLSAGGSNVDILGAFATAVRDEPKQLVVMSGRRESRLGDVARVYRSGVDLIDAEGPAGRDGFLATNSLLGFGLLIARAYSEVFDRQGLDLRAIGDVVSYEHESWSSLLARADVLWKRETLIALCSVSTSCGAVDLESKFTEAALGQVQVADYRNFAHGRHHWLAKRGSSSAVLAFTSDEDRRLATRTLALLPKSTPVLTVDLPGSFLEASLHSMLTTFRLVGAAGVARGIDPGRPGVPEFGRRLFSLRPTKAPVRVTRPDLTDSDAAAIERKASGQISDLEIRGDLSAWLAALTAFKRQLAEAEFHAAVFDYDGTLVDSKDRFAPPRPELTKEIVRLLEAGLLIGIASGRGPSIRRDLCPMIPAEFRPRVIVGYYNGGQVSTLDDPGCPDNVPTLGPPLEALGAALRRHPELGAIATQADRYGQITLEPRCLVPEDRLWELANQVVQSEGPPDVVVVRSSHSVDILAPLVSKTSVLDAIRRLRPEAVGAQILKVGDRGRWPGNDFALLREPFALSVDEVSVDPATCWNLSPRGLKGSEATLCHLRSLAQNRRTNRWRYALKEL